MKEISSDSCDVGKLPEKCKGGAHKAAALVVFK